MTTGDTVRMTRHPSDPDVVMLSTPSSLNQLVAQLPVTWAQDLRGFVMHHEAVPALYRWGNHHDVHVVDDRAPASTSRRGGYTPMPECRSCGQPARRADQPVNCPGCGAPWQPIIVNVSDAAYGRRTRCASCNHEQTGRFAYCAHCGNPMSYDDNPTPHEPVERVHLDDPLPLADTVTETINDSGLTPPATADVAACDDTHPDPATREDATSPGSLCACDRAWGMEHQHDPDLCPPR